MKTKIIAAILLAAIIFSAVACSENHNGETESGSESEKEISDSGSCYPYEEQTEDFGGYTFLILTEDEDEKYWANPLIVPDGYNSDLVNDAMYVRNLYVEKLFNIKIEDVEVSEDDIHDYALKAVMSSDDIYDLIMYPVDTVSAAISEDYLVDLQSIPEIHLDEEWWDSNTVEEGTINGKLFFATGDLCLFPFEASWVLYFNEEIMQNLKLEMPYSLGREGRWTVDRLFEYCIAAADLNGDGETVGLGSHSQVYQALLYGCDEDFISYSDGLPEFDDGGERLINAANKIADLICTDGAFTESGMDAFREGKFLFYGETLGWIDGLRSFEPLGVMPFPKYDENQSDYKSMVATWGTLLTVIPTTKAEVYRTGAITDRLAYESHYRLLEPYYDKYLTQKGARNEDSAEMLEIIRRTRSVNIGRLFGWTGSICSSICNTMQKENRDFSSKIEAGRRSVTRLIERTLGRF